MQGSEVFVAPKPRAKVIEKPVDPSDAKKTAEVNKKSDQKLPVKRAITRIFALANTFESELHAPPKPDLMASLDDEEEEDADLSGRGHGSRDAGTNGSHSNLQGIGKIDLSVTRKAKPRVSSILKRPLLPFEIMMNEVDLKRLNWKQVLPIMLLVRESLLQNLVLGGYYSDISALRSPT